MNNVFRIARTELRLLFYSPIAWLVLIAFTIQLGLSYFDQIEFSRQSQDLGGYRLMELYRLVSRTFFEGESKVVVSALHKFFLYIPLITMALLSRETGSGTIKLLLSSPVRLREIILGKYLATVIFSLLMTAVIGIFMVAGIFHIENADGARFASAALGIFFVLCAYSAIGLFMSSLTNYQIVAAIASFAGIGALSSMQTLWQQYDFVRDLTWFISLGGRSVTFLNGLITTSGIFYFIIVISMFLAFTYFRLQSTVRKLSLTANVVRYSMVVIVGLALGYISSRPALTGYVDVTKEQTNTLTPKLQNIIKTMTKGPIEVTTYNNILGRYAMHGVPLFRNRTLAQWNNYLRFKPDMDFNFVQYYNEPLDTLANIKIMNFVPGGTLEQSAKQVAYGYRMRMKHFKTPAQINKIIDLKPELNRFVMQLKYNGRSEFLRLFDDPAVWPREEEVGAAFRRLTDDNIPHAYFVSDNMERSIYKKGDRDLNETVENRMTRFALINQGFDVDTIALNKKDIPSDASILVLVDPKTELSELAIKKINAFIDKGGNLLIACEPERKKLLDPVFKKMGIKLLDGKIVEPSKNYSVETVMLDMTPVIAGLNSQLLNEFKINKKVVMEGATGLAYNDSSGFTAEPFLNSNPKTSWLKQGKFSNDSAEVIFNPSEGDIKQSFPLALGLSRIINGKKQRIFVAGDADFMRNGNIVRYDMEIANNKLVLGIFSWLNYGEFPIDAPRMQPTDNRLIASKKAIKQTKLWVLWIFPASLFIFGGILLIRRKRN